ncbi:SAV_6107 family HEPN domain-containing protein [Nocardioides zeae]|uniref:SAV_6107 family HEPN domain-containing protein n=1 Tax=Nocardioides imazamoxiresistens TaxID=3231893 RepID=A0ABU3Q0C0_9ACTN|nr:SAV_6107 family HEPN domain-containing protein [Nocardioides zeae]MDT9594492.1 SAV_6107 family HEPN domain-containing protein [Nocardioides zeae]
MSPTVPSAVPSALPGAAPTGATVLPAAAHAYLGRAATSLRDATVATDAPTRYACAHVAALQAAAALLSARTTPVASPRRRSRNAWVLLTETAPELASWAALFAAGSQTYQAARAGSTRGVALADADAVLGQADRFLAVVEGELGLLPHQLFTHEPLRSA